jgi:benzoyl-CoA reductase/2-hydroxyglutaryl-CoA dehydratase subunit BcrC/BadD/HgdB
MEKQDYTKMWKDLDLDLEVHGSLLNVLGDFYGQAYLSQKNRPQGMGYLDFVVSEVHGLRIKEILDRKEKGDKVFGTFCLFVPEELILAANSVCIGLCSGADVGTEEAEKYLPRNTCALIKSFVGFKLARVCPYVESCDLIIGETTCDGKKKAYEIFNDFKPTYVMEIPQMKGSCDRDLWKSEVLRLKEAIEDKAGVRITSQALKEAIVKVNKRRQALRRLSKIRGASPSPISGLDALLANQVAFYDDPDRFTEKINELCDELEERVSKGIGVGESGTPRIVISGSPMAIPNWKVPMVIEQSGAVVVGEESCIGERSTRDLVPETGQTVDEMIDHIVDRYMKIDCACFTPNDERLDHIVELARSLNADGVVHYAIQFCSPYSIEAFKVEKRCQEERIPFMKIETDYSLEDFGQLQTRIQAFLEQIEGARVRK